MNLSDTTTSFNITGLTPNTGYNVSLSAWTSAGKGETSTTMGMTNKEGNVNDLLTIITRSDIGVGSAFQKVCYQRFYCNLAA